MVTFVNAEFCDRLLSVLRQELDSEALEYRSPPSALSGVLSGHSGNVVCRVRLADGDATRDVVVRVYRGVKAEERHRAEVVAHGVLRELGYPVPRLVAAGGPRSDLGGPVAVFETLKGWNGMVILTAALPLAFALGVSGLLPGAGVAALAGFGVALAHFQWKLHSLPPQALARRSMEAGIGAFLDPAGRVVEVLESAHPDASLAQLRSAIRWLREHRPPDGEGAVICHGDFQPANVILNPRGLSGVVDWEGVALAPAEFDLATTHVRLAAQSEPSTTWPLVARWIAAPVLWVVSRALFWLIFSVYRLRRRLHPERLRYYTALQLLYLLAQTRGIPASDGIGPPHEWSPRALRRIRRWFERLTGVSVEET